MKHIKDIAIPPISKTSWSWTEGSHPAFVTQVYAFMGRRGSGKTYNAGVLAESMLDADAQVIVVDPVGNWWGLRVHADGDKPGYQIPVLGGDHGDLPLPPESGTVVADMLVDTGSSVVLDISEMRKGERKRFLEQWAEQFFHRKKKARSACHVFLEEAHLFLPQKAMAGEERMLGALEDLVRLGRNYGIGVTMIDQRPQSVSKDALNQAECLAVFQLVGPQERDAIKRWTENKDARSAMGELGALASLPQGECYLWSPQWLKTETRIRFRRKKSYDASSTPENGHTADSPQMVLPIDLGKLSEAMAAAVKTATDNDPKALRAKIKELETKVELATLSSTSTINVTGEIARLENERDKLSREVNLLLEQRKQIREAVTTINEVRARDTEVWSVVTNLVMSGMQDAKFAEPVRKHREVAAAYDDVFPPPPNTARAARTLVRERRGPTLTAAKGATVVAGGISLFKHGELAVLQTLKAFRRPLTTRQLAVLTARADRTIQNILQGLRGPNGMVVSKGDHHYLEPLGSEAAGPVPKMDTWARIERWRGQLDTGPRAVLDTLIEARRRGHPEGLSTAQIGNTTGHAERTVQNCLQVLRSSGLVLRGQPHKLNPDLFLEAPS